ncbi:glycerate kinase [Prosthecobacter vanneervenii]|uniref:Glycerate kinase n=1 Tax=Prosthecobacter vanneervenii TaxID=48466 RepID=A0A7W7Y712_9BACT|nr:glycerate kinase [Prosthecobacter vanneervenii]MBB5030779.1 glycerate kinase [Prosthecobacter vanneervenii]
MRILIAIDKFKGSIPASVAAKSIASALAQALPGAVCDLCPIADGGEGTAEAVVTALNGEWCEAATFDAQSRPVTARYGLATSAGQSEAVMEMSAASGLAMVSDLPLNPATASTWGTGLMLQDALERGVKRIVIGIGGSATNDAGIGMAAALGFRFLDAAGAVLDPIIANIDRLARIEQPVDFTPPEILVACDVNNPLLGSHGCTRIYGPQKGVTDFEFFENRVRLLADVAKRDLGADHRDVPGAGAAGGLGFGLMTFCGARLTSGFDLIADLVHLHERIAVADLIITGEGRMDAQTLHGKGPMGVADMAHELGKPVAAFAGAIEAEDQLRTRIDLLCAIKPKDMPLAEAMQRGPELLVAAVTTQAQALRDLMTTA